MLVPFPSLYEFHPYRAPHYIIIESLSSVSLLLITTRTPRAWKKASEISSRGYLDNSMGKLFRLLQSSHPAV